MRQWAADALAKKLFGEWFALEIEFVIAIQFRCMIA